MKARLFSEQEYDRARRGNGHRVCEGMDFMMYFLDFDFFLTSTFTGFDFDFWLLSILIRRRWIGVVVAIEQ